MTDSIIVDTATRIFADLCEPGTVNAAEEGKWPQALWDALEASGLTAFCRGFRQRFAGEIKPDQADLVDGGRIDAAQVAGNSDRFLLAGAIHHIQSQ